MFGEKKDDKGTGSLGEQPAAPDGLEGTPPTGDVASREGEKKAPPPPTARSVAGNDGGSYHRNQMILLAIGIAILIVVVVASSIALGFVLERHNGVVRRPGEMMRRGVMNRAGAGQLRQELKNLAGGGEVSIIRGNVATVEGGNVTIETPTGNETVVVADSTKFRGAGATGAQDGVSSLKAGQQVTVFAKKTTDGKLEAVVVRAGAEKAPNK